ncbi:hypothetical protein KSP39_PZI022184 [Platanthera zijinensis]|uniref:CCHC-type domain-containing protein n=1 Tax=Platanthera zijinensis TaxID=2320716 RepID=A0AAP0FUM9_9ASPA
MAAANSHMFQFSQNGVPIFVGEHYDFWKAHMRLLLQAQGLWELVDAEQIPEKEATGASKGGKEKETAGTSKTTSAEEAKNEAKALLLLHQGVGKDVYPRIMGAATPREAWNILQGEFQGSEKVISIKLQHQWKMWENISMKENESVKDFVSRIMCIVNQIRSLGDKLKDKKIAPKILRCLPPKFDPIVTTIEETKNIKTLCLTELMGSLQAHEERLKRGSEPLEQAFQTKTKLSQDKPAYKSTKPNQRGRGRGRFIEGRNSEVGNMQSCILCKRTNHIASECFYRCKRCKRPTHMEKDCWSKNKEEPKKKEEAKFLDTCERLFMTKTHHNETLKAFWYIDSGCSNHMTPNKHMFVTLDETKKSSVLLGDGKELKIEGMGDVAVISEDGVEKIIEAVHFVPSLAQSLLSVGQLMQRGYSILFEDGHCHIKLKNNSICIASVKMTENKMFPFNATIPDYALTCSNNSTALWHRRFCHLNIKSLKQLQEKEMVLGLPELKKEELHCEGCVMGKSHRLPFPTTSWKAKQPLELIHADLWGAVPYSHSLWAQVLSMLNR